MRNLTLIETKRITVQTIGLTYIYGTRILHGRPFPSPCQRRGGMEPTPSTAKNHVLLYFYSSIVFFLPSIDEDKSGVRLECISM